MDGRISRNWKGWRWLGIGLLCLAAGIGCVLCDHREGHGPDIAKGAAPAPLGAHLHEIKSMQIALAEADNFVIYDREWDCGAPILSPPGEHHLTLIAQHLADVPYPVLIEATRDLALNLSRRQVVVHFLALNGFPDAEPRVVIGVPEAEPLNGEEAPRLYYQAFLSRWNNNGGYGTGAINGAISPYGGLSGAGGFGGISGVGGIGLR